ncbi:hypothetical protein DUNSADRAFT_9624 [Dunaliella salina]|uniref:Uncharacterized protein n=1 Tax=Dunaliella salina TaxID=3046 RepID=A0ABQ7H5C4_DUNSA|nr:hypothetical protein DUNSADRAFT_9624 [Dunaliella salina]|eukprot:KAF5842055.1 hypothetical protein DUNSADRAFT_9624 [Dunaliella salina]
MKAISIHGPWAYYERAMAEYEAQIKQLREELAHSKTEAAEARQALSNEQARNQEHIECTVPSLHNAIDEASNHALHFEEQLQQTREQAHQSQLEAAAAHEAAMARMQQLLADNMVLKAELAKTVHTNHAASIKVEEVRKHLGLGKEEAEAFVKDLDSTKAANKALQAEVASLSADKAHLQQQCDNRSSHAMTLIAENKRLLEQVSELRKQVVGMDQDLWRAKQVCTFLLSTPIENPAF